MTDNKLIEKADEIAYLCSEKHNAECFDAALRMGAWVRSKMLLELNLLLDAIDHAYLQTDGIYGDLSYEVSDKVEYLKSLRKTWREDI